MSRFRLNRGEGRKEEEISILRSASGKLIPLKKIVDLEFTIWDLQTKTNNRNHKQYWYFRINNPLQGCWGQDIQLETPLPQFVKLSVRWLIDS